MNTVRSTGKMNAAVLGIIAMALCFAWGAWAQYPAVPADLGDTGDAEAIPVITITKQPSAAITLTQGQSDTLTIEASVTMGATLSYQWHYANAAVNCADETAGCEEGWTTELYGATGASIMFSAADFEEGTHVFYCVVSATNGAVSVQSDDAIVTVTAPVSVASADRLIASHNPGGGAAVSPVTALTAEFTTGPNPVARRSGGVNFFRTGNGIRNATFYVYDASGDVVRKISVNGRAVGHLGKRTVGAWDLRDSRGRLVPDGSYAIKGVLVTKDGKKETVSLVLGVK
ncbi:MAG: hypothetical protein LBB74_09815 [Chitinispirillales bacterium]|nr:hypothetical protein [Chitinispirillales bacterium]